MLVAIIRVGETLFLIPAGPQPRSLSTPHSQHLCWTSVASCLLQCRFKKCLLVTLCGLLCVLCAACKICDRVSSPSRGGARIRKSAPYLLTRTISPVPYRTRPPPRLKKRLA